MRWEGNWRLAGTAEIVSSISLSSKIMVLVTGLPRMTRIIPRIDDGFLSIAGSLIAAKYPQILRTEAIIAKPEAMSSQCCVAVQFSQLRTALGL